MGLWIICLFPKLYIVSIVCVWFFFFLRNKTKNMLYYWERNVSCVSRGVFISLPPLLAEPLVICKQPCPVFIHSSQGPAAGPAHPLPIALSSWSPQHIWLVFGAWYPQRNYRIGYNYACSDIIGFDINILATCEESLFLLTVYHLAAAHPFLARRGRTLFEPEVKQESD